MNLLQRRLADGDVAAIADIYPGFEVEVTADAVGLVSIPASDSRNKFVGGAATDAFNEGAESLAEFEIFGAAGIFFILI